MLNIPLMSNNIDQTDIDALIDFLQTSDRFTNGPRVKEFEKKWAEWLGVKYCVMVNSGSSANFMTLATVRELYGAGEVILSPIEWSSDIAAVMAAGMTPVFVDVDMDTLGMNEQEILDNITANTKAILLTHVLGYNAMTDKIREICSQKEICLIEDVCESHGATFNGKKCGSIGDVSNFSFYYAHHMSTIEGGMVCTNDFEMYRTLRMFRSHGMLRECDDQEYIENVKKEYPDLHPEFVFMVPGYNFRSTELNAVIGLNQMKRLDNNIQKRQANYDLFIKSLDEEKFYTDFKSDGSSNYAFVILLREKYKHLFPKLTNVLDEENVEYRRGTAGGGNLLRQPFVRKRYPEVDPTKYVNAEYIHSYGLYTGNYPSLEKEKIISLCEMLNAI